MDQPIDLGLTSVLLIHASGALTFSVPGQGPALWDDFDDTLLAVAA